jgi:hypothetical protein
MADNATLAEIFLGFGGRNAQVLGTTFTTVGVLYIINKSSGYGIRVIEKLPYWLGMQPHQNTEANAITREHIYNETVSYGKLSLLIGCGILLKKIGVWALAPTTIEMFNNFIYKK